MAIPVAEAGAYAGRLALLRARLQGLDGVLVAFSGGVDSGVLLHAAAAALGGGALGVIADSPSLPRSELAGARAFAAAIGARLEVVATGELADPRYAQNSGDRCYFCKDALFAAMELVAARAGVSALAFGELADDALDDRPGARAARVRGVIAPLCEAGFAKEDVRRYAREHGLSLADKPASACLASRLSIGTAVTRERLARVEAAEEALRALGLRGILRVRDRDSRARVELEAGELPRARGLARELAAALAAAGFEGWELAEYLSPRAGA